MLFTCWCYYRNNDKGEKGFYSGESGFGSDHFPKTVPRTFYDNAPEGWLVGRIILSGLLKSV